MNYFFIPLDKMNKILIIDYRVKSIINLLPREIQVRICILVWKEFWKTYVPLTAQPPSWMKYANHVQKELWQSKLNNIHFLHLPFNTLPENKKWIMGCQCYSCIYDTDVGIMEKYMHYLVQYRNPNYFTGAIAPESFSLWNEYYVFNKTTLLKIYDPLRGSYKENLFTRGLREGRPFFFTDYTEQDPGGGSGTETVQFNF